jgi:adenylate kinase family enzyme
VSVALPIILIGPEKCGKTTVGRLLAEALGVPLVHLWSVCQPYWNELGIDERHQRQSAERPVGEQEWNWIYHFMQPFDAHAVIRYLSEPRQCVLELGAPQSVYDNPETLARVRHALQPYPNVVLLVPGPDVEAAARVLEERTLLPQALEFNAYQTAHPSHRLLARHVVYNRGKTPEQASREIMELLDPSVRRIMLIGPWGAGKSTIGRLLARELDRPLVSVDEIRWRYMAEVGWEKTAEQAAFAEGGNMAVHRYWRPFILHAVRRLLAEHPDEILDFGGSDLCLDHADDLAQVQALLAPCPNVICVFPAPGLEEATAALAEVVRQRHRPTINGMDATRFFLTHPSNAQLARHVVYTDGKTPAQTCAEILARIVR